VVLLRSRSTVFTVRVRVTIVTNASTGITSIRLWKLPALPLAFAVNPAKMNTKAVLSWVRRSTALEITVEMLLWFTDDRNISTHVLAVSHCT
jgi:hypothetical protein